MTATLEVENLSKAFGGVRAVRDVSFSVDAGEIVAIIGPNGAGKSSCFNMLGGQLAVDDGRIRLNGRTVTRLGPAAIARAGIGRTFQLARVFGSMTVLENVQAACLSHARRHTDPFRRGSRQFEARAGALLAEAEMGAAADTFADHLAYGDVKRLELAMAFAGDPVLLLMDEPTAGMAPAERGMLMRHVVRQAKQGGRAVLFTEHDMDVVFGHAERVLVMDQGAVLAQGPPETVRDDPRVQRVYLGTPERPDETEFAGC